MHPGNIVFNPSTMHRLAEEIGATHVGAEMDPSHLFWQGIDPVARRQGPRRARVQRRRQGHPDQRGRQGQRRARRPVHPRSPRASPATCPGRRHHAVRLAAATPPGTSSPSAAATTSSWWTEFLRALRDVDPDMAVNIEHEDQELDQLEGLTFAANTLLEAEKAL